MPVQAATAVSLPWDDLADAYEQWNEALRNNGDVEGARRRVDCCREECGSLGGLLLTLALDHAGDIVRKRLLAVFGLLGREALRKASAAANTAVWAAESVDALKVRLRDLERRVADLTHGIGEPRRTL